MRCDKPESARVGVDIHHFLEVITNSGPRADSDLAVWMPLLGDAFNAGDFDCGFWVFSDLEGNIKILMREKTPDVGMADVIPMSDTFFWSGSFDSLKNSLDRIDARLVMHSMGDCSAQHLLSVFLAADSGTVESQNRDGEEALRRYGLDF